MFRFGGSSVADVGPTTGHVEINIPLINVGGLTTGIRYSGAHRWEMGMRDPESFVDVFVAPAGTNSAVEESGVYANHPVRSWRTMPLYRLRIVPVNFVHLGVPGNSGGFSNFRVRYLLTDPDGTQHEFREFRDGGEKYECMGYYHTRGFASSRWRTLDGTQMELDHSDPRNVVITIPGGSKMHFPWETQDFPGDSCNGPPMRNARKYWSFESSATRVVDRNGNFTTYADQYDSLSKTGTVTVRTSGGIEVLYRYARHDSERYDTKGNALATATEDYIRGWTQLDVTEIEFPGVGGTRLRHRLIWTQRKFDELALVNPILPGPPQERASRLNMLDMDYWVLERVELADGGAYKFRYHDTSLEGGPGAPRLSDDGYAISDGRVFAVEYPTGGRTEFEYSVDMCHSPNAMGDSSYRFTCPDAVRRFDNSVLRNSPSASHCTANGCMDPASSMLNYLGGSLLQRFESRRVEKKREFSSQSALARETLYSRSVEFGIVPDCRSGVDNPTGTCGLFSIAIRTGNHTRVTKFFTRGSRRAGQVSEILDFDGDAQIRKETFDGWEYEEVSSLVAAEPVNMRSTISHVEEGGLVIDTRTEFDRTGGSLCRERALGEGAGGCIPQRFTRGQVLSRMILQNGNVLRVERFEYEDAPGYISKGLTNLVRRKTVLNPDSSIAQREDRLYDETAVVDAPGAELDPIATPRGNVTRIRTWFDDARFADATATYFATGDVQSETTSRGATVTYSTQFTPCTEGTRRLTVAINALGQEARSELDCYTGSLLASTDENGKQTFATYDVFGRPLKTWSSGHSEQSPTTWYEYFPFSTTGSVDSQRVVEHTRDGSPDGIVNKTFLDGLGRVVQTRSEIDPQTTQGGYGERVVTTTYDEFGRVARAYEPCGDVVADRVLGVCTTNVVLNQYDVLGRATVVDLPGDSITRTRHEVTADGTLAISEDGVGGISRVLSDGLGRRVRIDTFWGSPDAAAQGCANGFCATRFGTDAAGRVTRITDARGNTTTARYDWAGRVERHEDPDLGVSTMEYDDDGREKSRTDASGTTTRRYYDVLGRLTIEDRAPAGPGVEDIRHFYDGVHATDCYSCDDHDPSTSDRCNAETFLCEHYRDGEEIWTARDTTNVVDSSYSEEPEWSEDEFPADEGESLPDDSDEELPEEYECDPEFELCE